MVCRGQNLKRNVLIAVQGADHPLLKSHGLVAAQLHWVDRTPITEPVRCSVKPAIVKVTSLVPSFPLVMTELK